MPPTRRDARRRKIAKRSRSLVTEAEEKPSSFKPRCDVCAKIVNHFKRPVPKVPGTTHWEQDTLELGKYEEVMISTSCKTHPLFFQSLFDSLEDRDDLAGALLKVFQSGRRHFSLSVEKSDWSTNFPLMLLSTSAGLADWRARSTNQHWIDKNILLHWKQTCDAHGREDCQYGPAITRVSSIRPRWLIDTWRLCLVPGTTGTSYVSLSYVWGKDSFFTTSRETLCQLQSDFALSNAHRNLGVPKTVFDAIAVVGLLKERYLWVDSLCIVQDDEATKHTEISNMAYIYSGASITIIAAQGEDANYGLRGLRDISEPRNRPRVIFRPGKGYEMVLAAPRFVPRRSHSLWSQRGWTFQEQIFSRRRLIFEEDSIEWQCSCSIFQEDVEARPGSRIKLADTDSAFDMSFPSLEGYGRLMRNYNLRDFTHSEDALAAISGTTTALSQHFRGGFLCGLPLMFLDVALCWQPFGYCQRRTPTGDKAPTELRLPSWSWVGWKCDLDLWCWNSGRNFVKSCRAEITQRCTQQTLSITQWFSRRWETLNYRPVGELQLTMLQWRACGLQGKVDPPPGWNQFVSPPLGGEKGVVGFLEGWIVNGQPHHFYMHENDPYSEFWYPIPLVDESKQQPPLNQDDTLLCCRTQRAWFRLSERIQDTTFGLSDPPLDMDYHRNCLTQSIRDVQECWAGALTLNSSDPSIPLGCGKCGLTEKPSYCQHMRCELVAISKGYAIELGGKYDNCGMPEWHLAERPKSPSGGKYWYYNVLWVEWNDGIAYRKGCGRVTKSAWEAEDLEWIDLILG